MNRLRRTRVTCETAGLADEKTNDDDDDDAANRTSKYTRRRCVTLRWTVASVVAVTVLWFTVTTQKESDTSPQFSRIYSRGYPKDSDHGLSVADVLARRTVSVTESFKGRTHNVTPMAHQQIHNYQHGTALIVNVHFTHHGGTFACHALGAKATGQTGSPSFACMGVTDADNVSIGNYPKPERVPWTKSETSRNIEIVRPFFHFLNWEFGAPETAHLKGPPLAEADWENPNMVSILIMRDPLSRLLAIDGWVRKHHPTILNNTATRKEWMDYATTPHNNTNNFALAILAGPGCCQGKDTNVEHLVAAKKVVSRMTFVLDIACLKAGLEEVAHLLGFEAHTVERRLQTTNAAATTRNLKLHRKWPSPKERLPPKIYDFLVERNRLDIELYEWSKEISLVRCSDLS